MLDSSSLYRFIAKYGIGRSIEDSEVITFEEYLSSCRRSINDRIPNEYYNWSQDRQDNYMEDIIIQFVNANQKVVEGFVEDGVINTTELIDKLITTIMDFGILREALDNPKVQEIQINDYRTIWVVIGGKIQLYCDKRGNPYQFVSNDELKSTLYRLCYNPNGNTKRMTSADPLLNTRATVSGYRISGVNDTAITPDKIPYDFPITSYTIRKFNAERFSFEDYIKIKSLTKEMAQALKIFAKAPLKLFFIGPTSSGKTTLLGTELYEVPEELRIILIQNPTEVMLYDRDVNGTNKRNVLHWEAEHVPQAEWTETKNTMANCISHTLRNTPDIIVPGEARMPAEFYEMYRVILTGQRIMGTFHSENGQQGLERFATETATHVGGSKKDYLTSLAANLDIFVAQYKMDDGSRKVMEISESTGKLDEHGNPEVVKLFEFVPSGKAERDETGRVTAIHGQFLQTGVISDRLKRKIFLAGFNSEEVEFLTNEENCGRVLMEV